MVAALMSRGSRDRLRAHDRRECAIVEKFVSSFGGKRIIVTTRLILDSLCDPVIGRKVAESLALAAGTASGDIETKRQCFVCCQPWAAERAPIGMMKAEIVGMRPRHALLTFICNWCWASTEDIAEGVAKGLERDLGCKRDTVQFIHDPVEAD
jgi:hypothetical protein